MLADHMQPQGQGQGTGARTQSPDNASPISSAAQGGSWWRRFPATWLGASFFTSSVKWESAHMRMRLSRRGYLRPLGPGRATAVTIAAGWRK